MSDRDYTTRYFVCCGIFLICLVFAHYDKWVLRKKVKDLELKLAVPCEFCNTAREVNDD